MVVQDELAGFYWLRLVAGGIFFIGLILYVLSFFIQNKNTEPAASAV